MNRRDLFRVSSAMGVAALLPALSEAATPSQGAPSAPLTPPAVGSIPVAFLMSDGAVMIDFAGPWEVFSNVNVMGRDADPVFKLYTVAATSAPIKASGGMTIVPEFTFETAPQPKVIVIPAQSTRDEKALAWLRAASQQTDLTMSVCTGAFILARTGLLSGKAATTYHGAFSDFAMRFPDIALKRGARFVESGQFASSGGLSSGIDLALRVVERYFGRDVASSTAYTLEYQGQGWRNPDSNMVYAKRRTSPSAQPLCPVCDMAVSKAAALSSTYRGRSYYFCMAEHKKMFDAGPAGFAGV